MSKKKPAPAPFPKGKAKPPAPREPGGLTKVQAFVVERVHRRQLKNAPYNPRFIDDAARKKLKGFLEQDGLVETLVWNRKTGNLVGGHQRISLIDDIEQTDDYLIDVSVIDVSLKAERRINARLNNPHAQGMYDPDALAAMVLEEANDAKSVLAVMSTWGFDKLAAEDMLADTDAAALLDAVAIQVPASEAEAVDELGAMSDAKRASDAAERAAKDAPRLATGEVIRDPEAHARIIEERDKSRAKKDAGVGNTDTENFIIITFVDRAQREALNTALGRDPDSRYVDGVELAQKLGVDLEPPTEESDE